MSNLIKMDYQGRRGQFFRKDGWETFYISRPGKYWISGKQVKTPGLDGIEPPSDAMYYQVEKEMIAWCNDHFQNRWHVTWHTIGMMSFWHFEETHDAMLFKTCWDGVEW